MYRWLVGVLLLLAGCQNVVGPARREAVRVDDPRLPIAEQERRGRAFLGVPDESYLSGPQTGVVNSEAFNPTRK
jgi:hypothetical protein